MPRWSIACFLAAGMTFVGTAADPKPAENKAYDKLVVDTLRDVHNRGADLYNTARDFTGTYRMYQGALVTVRPLLAHRTDVQKVIDAGLVSSEREADPARQAFLLHETIEKVRALLKVGQADTPKVDAPKVDLPKLDKPKTELPEAVKPKIDQPKVDVPKVDKPKVDTPKVVDPPKTDPLAIAPKAKEPGKIEQSQIALAGKVMRDGKPIGSQISLVSTTLPLPRVFQTTIGKDGAYQFPSPIPAGKYIAIVAGKDVPEKYQTTTASPVRVEFPASMPTFDIELK